MGMIMRTTITCLATLLALTACEDAPTKYTPVPYYEPSAADVQAQRAEIRTLPTNSPKDYGNTFPGAAGPAFTLCVSPIPEVTTCW